MEPDPSGETGPDTGWPGRRPAAPGRDTGGRGERLDQALAASHGDGNVALAGVGCRLFPSALADGGRDAERGVRGARPRRPRGHRRDRRRPPLHVVRPPLHPPALPHCGLRTRSPTDVGPQPERPIELTFEPVSWGGHPIVATDLRTAMGDHPRPRRRRDPRRCGGGRRPARLSYLPSARASSSRDSICSLA